MSRRRPDCPYCEEPCALPEDFDGIDRAIQDPWCQNTDCTFVGERYDTIPNRDYPEESEDDMHYKCNNECQGKGYRLTMAEVVPIIPEKLVGRFTEGDTFSEHECSHCGAVALPQPDDRPSPKLIAVDYEELAEQREMITDLGNMLAVKPLSRRYRLLMDRLEQLLRVIYEQRFFPERKREEA